MEVRVVPGGGRGVAVGLVLLSLLGFDRGFIVYLFRICSLFLCIADIFFRILLKRK